MLKLKKLIFLPIYFCVTVAYGQLFDDPWKVIFTLEQNRSNLKALDFANQSIAFAVGDHGTIQKISIIIKKEALISAVAAPTSANLNDINFCDHKYGYIAGDKGVVLYTNDGGGTWEK